MVRGTDVIVHDKEEIDTLGDLIIVEHTAALIEWDPPWIKCQLQRKEKYFNYMEDLATIPVVGQDGLTL